MPRIVRYRLPIIAGLVAAVMGLSMAFFGGAAPADFVRTPDGVVLGDTPHKALYDFKMISVESGSGIAGVSGQMYYEQEDVCDAVTTENRFTIVYHYPERQPVRNTSHYVSWESRDGSLFHFNSERQEDGVPTEQLRGSVARGADGSAKAEYARPEDMSFDLPAGYLLPMEHTREILRRAAAGETFFNAPVFDGTDADGPMEIAVFIGKKTSEAELSRLVPPSGKVDRSLLQPEGWHVHMSIFPLADKGEMTPVYEMDMILHQNGVISHVIVDYKTFRVEQTLSALEKITGKKCS